MMSEYINNGERRKEALKEIILDLHAGKDVEEVKRRFHELIQGVSAVEIARMEQELIDEGLPAEEVRELCDVHVAVFQEGLEGETTPEMTPGHPVHTFKYENFALGEVIKLLREAVAALPDADALRRAQQFAEQLATVDKVYTRKENLLFPMLEKHGVTGPTSVMWGTHDQIRDQLKAFRQALAEEDAEKAEELWGPLAEAIESMFYKEEHILYPTALRMLTEAEWAAIRDQSDEIGYALIRPGDAWQPEETAEEAPSGANVAVAPGGRLALDTGALTVEQINLLLKNLPVDVTFVDENDTVRYFSDTQERIFVRMPAIIGRKVQNCHPPESVHIVNGLLDEMRQGKRDVAEFWIHMGEQYVHIRYFALRDDQGAYRGCIEVTQDVAPIQALTGERRLLDEAE
jgi:uncharacterized protein